MATLTKEQYEALKRQGRGTYRGQTSSSGQYIIEADKFVGDLQGNADTATRLRDPITISLGGDAEGSAQFAGSSFRLDATIREAEHSVNSDVAENAKHSAQASHADLANIATLALRSMLADNASHAEEASHANDSTHADSSDVSTLATRALHADDAYHADEADNATFALKDSNGDNIHNTFVDKQSQITTNTNNIATHEGTLTNHEGRISQAESNISSLDTRVGDIETSTDVGRITQRIVNIEAKDVEQDGRLDAINDTMVTLSTAQYILSPKTFNAGSKTIMDNEAGATEITNKEYVDNKVLSSANYVTDNLESYTDNKVLSASRYMTDYVDNKVLSTAQYVDDNFMSLTKSQYVTGLNTYNTVLPQSNLTPTNANDFITKKYFDENQSSGHALFDVVAKDHVLTYGKDLEGFAPLGTWVYKDAVDGSRYGYPDFVQKCLDEYAEATDDVIGSPFEQPILSANGTLGGDSFAVTSNFTNSVNTYLAFNLTNTSIVYTNNATGELVFYNPNALIVKSIKWITYDNNRNPIDYSVEASNDGENYTSIVSHQTATAGAETLIDLSINSTAYKYYKIICHAFNTNQGNVKNLIISAYEQYLDIKRHANGHIFFDVADIDKVNAYYQEFNHAWFYGIDEENERVFLPRQAHGKLIESYKNGTDWYRIYEDGWCEQGGVASSKTIYALNLHKPYLDTNYHVDVATINNRNSIGTTNITGNASISIISNSQVYISSYNDDVFLPSHWSACGYISLSNIEVTPFYEYMVVGNVKVQQASTEVIDATTTNNDTIPLFAPYYFDYTPNNLSWLKSGEQSNSGDLYKSCYNELVNVLNGDTKYGSLKVIDEADMVSGEDYSLYWIVDQVNETFRTPTKTQQRFVVKTWDNGSDWYRIYNDGWCEQGGCILENGVAQVRQITFAKPFGNTYYTVSGIYCRTQGAVGTGDVGAIGPSTVTTTGFEIWQYQDQRTYWTACGYIDLTNETFDTALYFKVANAVENIQMLNVGEVTEVLTSKADTDLSNVPSSKSILVESYRNGTSWYRIYSDGWCVQGGRATAPNGTITGLTVTLFKPYTDTNYSLMVTTDYQGGDAIVHGVTYTSKTASNFTFNVAGNKNNEWVTCGYIS